MRIEQLDEAGLIALYEVDMLRDFPPEERKPLEVQLELTRQGICRTYGAMEADALQAYAMVCGLPGRRTLLLDYYAVRPPFRGQGVGGWMLNALCRQFRGQADALLIETEKPDLAADEAQRTQRLRRDAFYLRHGARKTRASGRVFDAEYALWTINLDQTPDDRRVMEEYSAIYQTMIPWWTPEILRVWMEE